ncbi:MAG: carboxypeptidase M32 [candidate division Zixibacteria bacterium]|nr:carboxypeptidase M32 [candidate division Zixibacteria bacterium]
MTQKKAYDELVSRLREVALLSSCGSVLGWDERTYMPRGGGALRADQLAMISGLMHEKFTDPRIGELLSILEQSDLVGDEDSPEAANIRETRHDYDRYTKLPRELVEELAKTTTLAQGEWVIARKNKDFKHFLPWLEKVLALTVRKAEAYGYEGEPYNALLDNYEKGMTVEQVSATFEILRVELVELLNKIREAPKRPDVSIVEREYDVGRQRIFGESVAQAMGYNFDSGRLDVTTHPFCTGIGPGDTRITTRYNPKRLNDALFGTMHEAGHGLYEMGLEKETYFGTPMGESASLGIHESQSRMWENQVGRSKPFWRHFFPQAQRLFRDSLGGVKLDDFYAAINNVAPSYIRVEADEATYNLHILLRYELERAMVKGDLKPADVPGEWDKRFKDYFGIEVDNVANGCLQDVHWSAGLMGYFPTYSLGNLHSAQFFAKALEDMPDLMDQFEQGIFGNLREWLRKNIHKHGSRYRAGKLCEKVTGKPLSHKPLMDYMYAKFSEIYGF